MDEPSSESFILPYRHKLQPPSSLQPIASNMCTPWTLRRILAGHKAKDHSHLNPSTSRLQLKEDPNKPAVSAIQQSIHQHEQSNNVPASSSTASPRQNRTATTSVTRCNYSRSNEATMAPSRISVIKKGKHKRRVNIGSSQTSSSSCSLGVVDGGGGDETDWPPFTDEDYIVFCFEEDGEFHLVMDENPKSQDCSEHGHSLRPLNQNDQGGDDEDMVSSTYGNDENMDVNQMNRRDCYLPNKAVEEERFYFSPRLQSDGIKSLTRFKSVVDDEPIELVNARGRVDKDMDYEDMDGIKRRGQCNEEEEEDMCEDDHECHKTSMECRDGSVESAASSQSNWVRQLQVTKTDLEIGLPSSSQAYDDPSSSKNGKLVSLMYTRDILQSIKMGDDEESVYLSSESQQGGSQGDNEEEESLRVSAASQLEEDEEATLDSAESKCSISSSSSFEFPELQWDWIGSPVKWQRTDSVRMRKPKFRRVCIRCCRF